MTDTRKVTATIGGETVEMIVVEGAVLNEETRETVNDYDSEYEEDIGGYWLVLAVFMFLVSCLLLMSWSVLNVG